MAMPSGMEWINIAIKINRPRLVSPFSRNGWWALLLATNRSVNRKKAAPKSRPRITTYGALGILSFRAMPSCAREKTEAEIIIPAAMAEENARTTFESFLTKWTGMAPRPVARALRMPVRPVQNISDIWSIGCIGNICEKQGGVVVLLLSQALYYHSLHIAPIKILYNSRHGNINFNGQAPMIKSKFKYIYGPVYSWRLGMSLGIDPLTTQKKICNYDCIYCQLGRTTEFYTEREDFVRVEDIMAEIGALPPGRIDFYTFSGRGEPTLAKNLGAMIRAVREAAGGKIVVITNAGLIDRPDVQEDLFLADWVLAKLDAADQASFQTVDIPARGIEFQRIVEGIKDFKKEFKGKLALQVMFVEENKHCAPEIVRIAREINADEVRVNTPLRPGAMMPLAPEELKRVLTHFQGMNAVRSEERRV